MLEGDDSIRQEVEQLRTSLRTCVEESGISRGTVARMAELSEEELAEILRVNGPSLELDQIHAVLEALDVMPEEFYGELFGFRAASSQEPGGAAEPSIN